MSSALRGVYLSATIPDGFSVMRRTRVTHGRSGSGNSSPAQAGIPRYEWLLVVQSARRPATVTQPRSHKRSLQAAGNAFRRLRAPYAGARDTMPSTRKKNGHSVVPLRQLSPFFSGFSRNSGGNLAKKFHAQLRISSRHLLCLRVTTPS